MRGVRRYGPGMNSRTRLGTALTAFAALTLLAGCGSGEGQPETAAPAPATSEAAGTASSAPASTGGDLETALVAIETAEGEASGDAKEIDFDDGTGEAEWHVDVRTPDGLVEIRITADGTSVIEAKGVEAPDADETTELDAATAPLPEVLTAATEQTPGTIDDAELETRDGTVVYEVEIVAADGSGSKTVAVDAASGQVVG